MSGCPSDAATMNPDSGVVAEQKTYLTQQTSIRKIPAAISGRKMPRQG
jgi:hypothetical protein